MSVSTELKAWVTQIRTQGFEALWDRLIDSEREEFTRFAKEFDQCFDLEIAHHWQDAADRYATIGEVYPAWSDVAVARASHVVTEKLNRAIRYYNQGIRSVELRQYEKALQFFDLALNIDQNMHIARYNLGMTHKIIYISDPAKNKLNKLSAIETFKKMLGQNPRHAKAAAQIEQLQRL